MAAEHVLDTHGYSKFSMASVSSGSGLSIGGMYAHFANKEALLRQVKNEVLGKLENRLEKQLEAHAGSLEGSVGAFVSTLSKALSDQGKLFAFIFAQSVNDADMRRRGFQFHQHCKNLLHHSLLVSCPALGATSKIDILYEIVVQSLLMRVTSLGTVSDSEHMYDGFPARITYETELMKIAVNYLAPDSWRPTQP